METQKNWSSPIVILTLVGMLLVAGVVTVSILRDRIVNPGQHQVSVTGQGKVNYQPDIAIVNLGVQVDRAKTAEEAISQLDAKMQKIITDVEKLGVKKDDIQTQGYSVYTMYDYIENVTTVAGYNANQQLTIKVRDISPESDMVSTLITAATKAGANQVNGVTFDASNIEQLKQQARLAAIADAKSKAGTIADAAGVRLGKIIGWWDNFVQVPYSVSPYYYDGKGGMGGAQNGGTVPSGASEIIIEVNLNYQVK